ncbi:uncharacterized protein LOC110932977 [Helianthus annuus]|uniref:uncharacterized protein LOC110932977 n=1 Tax=Helianthus annuus TaxID=4232 RepID=UPI000B8F0FB9|nr:uncharacterized protein LOC110932977 [Helianthus annuus]
MDTDAKDGNMKGGDGGVEDSDDDEVTEVGLNRPLKQKEVRQIVKEYNMSFCAILESHVDVGNLNKVCKSVFLNWDWTSNGGQCDKGTRIIIGWNPEVFDVMVLNQTSQVMHVQIWFKADSKMVFCSIVYAANYYVTRRDLWQQLSMQKVLVGNQPWIVMGDFNSALNIEDKSLGASSISAGMREFQNCVDDIEVFDINSSGLHFTWNQKPKEGVSLLKKIDRVLVNTQFVVEYPSSIAIFHPYRTWELDIDGAQQFRVFKKLRALKTPLRALLFKQGKLHRNVNDLRSKLDGIQSLIDTNPLNVDLRAEESFILRDYQEACLDEERFLKQRSKVDWLHAGDMNTTFFHSSLKSRNHRSRINVIKDSSGMIYEGEDVQLALVTADEVRKAMFSIGIDKTPGPDGYSSAFFKGAWSVIDEDVSNAIIDFFSTGKLLRELNHTLIVLVPKIATPCIVTDYRPIACCNVMYKCISKILADRLKVALNMIVNVNQSAFVPGRKISDNILLTQELMHNYHRNVGPPRCAFKVDIQKAYDTVDWRFLKRALIGFGFVGKMVEWIMSCVSTPTYSVCVDGNIHGYFKGQRGLRQGDPISPYLFMLVMAILTGILHHETRMDSLFRFHNRCEKQQIVNLCFADDLFLFARGDVNSAKCIMASLSKFTNMSGLVPSVQKSTVFFCNVTHPLKTAILSVMPFVEGSLPVRYLGVPLISTRLQYKDCSILVEKLEKRITNWRNKLLSFAGRLQLILSVLSSMHIYWSSKGKAKVSWNSVCTPKYEGGLGIRCIGDVNKALMANHVWGVITKRRSLWVDWVHDYKLKGFRLDDTVADIQSAGVWRWPTAWRDLFPVLIQRAGGGVDENSLVWALHPETFFPDVADYEKEITHTRYYSSMGSLEEEEYEYDVLLTMCRSKLADDYVSRILVAATAYFIWHERNSRPFKNQLRPPEQVYDAIIKTVRYKLMGMKMKRTERVRWLLVDWGISDADINGDGE